MKYLVFPSTTYPLLTCCGSLSPCPLSLTELESAEELYQKRITRILATDFPHYFAIVTRIRQETNNIGPEGGMLSSTVVPQVQAVFPEGSLTKKIKVGLQVRGTRWPSVITR